jgi:EAL and modified HD-GYP domain-containing signal transduction protein
MAAAQRIFIGRQPILNSDQAIFAYELLFRDSAEATDAHVLDNDHASSRLIINTFNSLGIKRIFGRKQAFINVSAWLLQSEILELLPADRVVLEILEDVRPTPELVQHCRQLQTRGYQFALDDFVYRPELEPLLALARYVKLDVRALGTHGLAEQMRHVRAHRPTVIAEKVETQAEFRACRALGVDCFQGYYFARPETLSMRRIDPLLQHIIQLFNLILNRAEPEAIEASLRQDIALSFNLIRYINSLGSGLRQKVNSVKQALAALEQTKLARWLSLLLLSDTTRHAPPALFRTALVRARMTELLGMKRLAAGDRDWLFITGMLSLLDVLLSAALPEALKTMRLPEPIHLALVSGQGPYAPYLQIAQACETVDMSRVETLAVPLALTLADVTCAQMEALGWADEIHASAVRTEDGPFCHG